MVNGVSFAGQRYGVFDSASTVVDRPQAFSRTQPAAEQAPAPKKSHKALKVIGGLLATAAVVAGALALGKHFDAFNISKIAQKLPEGLKNNKIAQYVKEPVKKVIGWADKGGEWLLANGAKVVDKVKGWLPKKAAPAAPATPGVGTV